jgi:hypothetical protein
VIDLIKKDVMNDGTNFIPNLKNGTDENGILEKEM